MDRYGTDPRSFGATFWNLGAEAEKTAKKRRKNEQKWARYGLTKRVRAALLCLGNRYEDCLKEEAKGKLRRAAQRVEQKQREGGAARGPEAQGYR